MEQPAYIAAVPAETRVQLFFEGTDFFTSLEEAIRNAKSSIDVEFYYFGSDDFGWGLARLLVKMREAGVKVRVIVDAVGCISTSSALFTSLQRNGVQVRIYHPVFPFLKNFSKRDHRKMAIIDGRVGFIGGYNLAIEYDSRYSGAKAWRDTGARLTREVLLGEMQRLFDQTWERIEVGPQFHLPHLRKRPAYGRGELCIVANEGFPRRNFIRREYLAAILHARSSIELTNSYFVPMPGILRALKKAARRGVHVRLLTAGVTDVRVARWAGQATYAGLLKAGVRVFEYQGRVLHAKTAVIDGEWFTLGTANIDHWSLFQNLEVNLMGREKDLCAALSAQFARDLTASVEIEREQWKHRSWLVKLRERFFFYFRRWL